MKIIQILSPLTLIWLFQLCMIIGCSLIDDENHRAQLTLSVLDDQNEPIMGQEVTIFNQNKLSSITDKNGICSFNKLEPIITTILIDNPDYFTFYAHYALQSGRNDYTVYLNPVETYKIGFENGIIPYNWSTFGDEPWMVTDFISHTGNYSVKSGFLHTSESSYLRTVVPIYSDSTVFMFWYRVSIDSVQQNFRFTIDDESEFTISGQTEWEIYQGRLDAGQHTLTWSVEQYSHQTSHGFAWIDDLYIFYE